MKKANHLVSVRADILRSRRCPHRARALGFMG